MAYIEIYNNSNSVLIDDNALNHRLIQRGSSKTYNGFAMGPVVSVTRNINLATESMPICAWAARDNTTWMSMHQGYRPSTSDPNEIGWTMATNLPMDTVNDIDYYMFQDGLSVPMNGTGLVVCRRADGLVVFDSDENYANLVDFVDVPFETSFTRTYPADRKYAVSNVVPLVKRQTASPGGWGDVNPIGFNISGNVINFGKYKARPGGSVEGTAAGNDVQASFMVFDVTGL